MFCDLILMDGDAGTRKPANIMILMTCFIGPCVAAKCSIDLGERMNGNESIRIFYESFMNVVGRSSCALKCWVLGVNESRFSYAHMDWNCCVVVRAQKLSFSPNNIFASKGHLIRWNAQCWPLAMRKFTFFCLSFTFSLRSDSAWNAFARFSPASTAHRVHGAQWCK